MRNNTILLGLLALLLVVAGVILYADNSAPGDLLYSVDRGVESLEVQIKGLIGGKVGESEAHLALAEERIDELIEITGSTSALSLVSKIHAQEEEETEDDVGEVEPEEEQEVEEELADVIITAICFARSADIDIAKAVENKMKINAKRYPVEKAKGVCTKHDKL